MMMKVLIIADSPFQRKACSKIIESDPNTELIGAYLCPVLGSEALRRMEIDIVILGASINKEHVSDEIDNRIKLIKTSVCSTSAAGGTFYRNEITKAEFLAQEIDLKRINGRQ